MSRPLVLLPAPVSEPGMRLLHEHCEVVQPAAGPEGFDAATMARAEGVLVRLLRVDGAFLDRTPKLEVIARHGVGVDTVDVAEATRRKIAVVNTPGVNHDAVAEHAIHLMLGVSRRAVAADAMTRGTGFGGFAGRLTLAGYELTGKTIGIVGMGRVGARLAEMCAQGFSMTVLGYDPPIDPAAYTGPATLCESLDDLIRQVDILSLHAPATEETRNLLNAERIAAMKQGAVVINTARGSLIEEDALAAALESGHLAGAGLDVFAEEPLPPDCAIAKAPNTLFSPHVASSTREAIDRMARDSAQYLIDVLQGRRPKGIYNPEIYE